MNNRTSIGNLSYTWDANKNKTSETITGVMSGYGFTAAGTSYDFEDRLTGYSRASGTFTQSWNLTSVGDWTSVTTNGTAQSRTHGPTHELLTAGGSNVTTDVKGNITTLPTTLLAPGASTAMNLAWDFDNKMKSADIDANSSADVNFQYDALGRRVARTGTGGSTVYLQMDQQTIADYPVGGAASTPTYRYVYASYIDEPVVRKGAGTGGTILYYHRNQQYSVTAITTSTGAISERYAYSAYGQPTILDASGSILSASAISNRYTYTGREWDATLGLHHFRARWMSPSAGRFLGRDPIGYEGSDWDLYEYCSSKPLYRLDPTGKTDWSKWPSEYPRSLTPEQIEEMIKKETDPVKKEKLRLMKKIKEQFDKRIAEKIKGANKGNKGGRRRGSTCKGFLAKLFLFECEAACALNYDFCLDKALRTYEFCLQGAYSMDEPIQSQQLVLCDRINTLDFIDCAGTYAACGLGCLVGHDVVGGNEADSVR